MHSRKHIIRTLIVLALAVLVVALVACGSKPTPTPTATPVPTRTPVPTATPVPPTPTAVGWSSDAGCATCHGASYTESLKDTTLLVYTHAQMWVACLDCHDAAALQETHAGAGTDTSQLKERKYPNEFCFGCHGPNPHRSYEQVKQLTAHLEEEVKANPHDSHYGEMNCRICHKMHRESEDYCAQCHEWEWQVP